MKNQRFTSILSSALIAGTLVIGSLASTQAAVAQNGNVLAEADIPFAFQNGDQQMPAGIYRIDRESNHLVLLHGPSNVSGYVLMHPTIARRTPTHGKIVFDYCGNKYFLRQVWTAGDDEGLERAMNRAEKEVLQAQNEQAPSSIQLALNSVPKQ
jgi:hypothetical protein